MTELTTTGVADTVVRQYGLRPDRVELLGESFNTLFTVACDDDKYVLRVGPTLHIHEPDAAQAEAAWTDDLTAVGLTVPRLIRAVDGRAAVTLTGCGDTARTCTLCSWVNGVTLAQPMSADDATELGELSARLHAASTPLPERPYGVLDGRSALLFRLPDLLDRAAAGDVFTTARVRAQAALDRLWASAGTPRQVHGDLTASNVVRTREALVPIDFQDMFWGHRQQDIANTLFSYLRDDDGTRAEYFRSGYERHMPWPGFNGVELDDLFAARRLMMVNLAIALDRPGVDDYLTMHADALRKYGSTHIGIQT